MNDKKERDIMAVYTKPVNKAFITTEEEFQKILKSHDPEVMKRILKNAERINKQFVDKKDNVGTGNKT